MNNLSLDEKADHPVEKPSIINKVILPDHISSCHQEDDLAAPVSHKKDTDYFTDLELSKETLLSADQRIKKLQTILQPCPVLNYPSAQWNPDHRINHTPDSTMHRSFFGMDPKSDSLQYMSLRKQDDASELVPAESPNHQLENEEKGGKKRVKISLDEHAITKQSKNC